MNQKTKQVEKPKQVDEFLNVSDQAVPQRIKGHYVIPEYREVDMVKGRFKNIESPGYGIEFPFRGNWKGPVKKFFFLDGGEYTIPREVSDHLNGDNAWDSCTYKQMKWVSNTGEEVTAIPVSSASMPDFYKKIGKKTARFMFQITG